MDAVKVCTIEKENRLTENWHYNRKFKFYVTALKAININSIIQNGAKLTTVEHILSLLINLHYGRSCMNVKKRMVHIFRYAGTATAQE